MVGMNFASLAMTAGAFLAGFAVWLPADLWFFLAQRQSRTGQFAPFEAVSAVARLARYSAATLFGGSPLYVDGTLRTAVTAALALLLIGLIALVIRRWRHIATPETRLLFAMATAAPPIGLLLLGFVFDNAPIELRYLAFATPYIGLLLAATLPRRSSRRSGDPGHRAARPDDPPGDYAAGPCNGDRGRHRWSATASYCCHMAMTASASSAPSPSKRRRRCACWWSAMMHRPREIRARASGFPRAALALLGQDGRAARHCP